MAKNKNWLFKPNWWLLYNGKIIASWYCHTKREARVLAKCYVDEAKKRNKIKPKSQRVYKKDFALKNTYKGADDA